MYYDGSKETFGWWIVTSWIITYFDGLVFICAQFIFWFKATVWLVAYFGELNTPLCLVYILTCLVPTLMSIMMAVGVSMVVIVSMVICLSVCVRTWMTVWRRVRFWVWWTVWQCPEMNKYNNGSFLKTYTYNNLKKNE